MCSVLKGKQNLLLHYEYEVIFRAQCRPDAFIKVKK